MRLFVAAALLTCLSTPALVAAQSPPPKEKQLAKLQEDAVSAYNKKQFDKALEAFQKMYELDPNPLLLYNIGRCQESLGKKRDALKSYKLFLEKVPQTNGNYEKAKKSADALEAEIGPELPPAPKPPAEPLYKRALDLEPKAYYGGAIGLGVVATTFGIASLNNAFALRNRAEDDTFDDSGRFARRMRLSAVASDAFFVLAAGTALYGYQRSRKLDEAEPSARLLLSPSGVSLALEFQ
jgi:tetratricopeptide (TPR) repeat protein